jgi:hypothetical protein
MKIAVNWDVPVHLKKSKDAARIYDLDLEELPAGPGIYVFARSWGTEFEALYVGRSKSLRGRVKGHLNSLKLMSHIRDAKNGKRVLFTAKLAPRPGQKIDTLLALTERALIRHFLAEAHDLVNIKGVRISGHEFVSQGLKSKSFVPGLMYLERG